VAALLLVGALVAAAHWPVLSARAICLDDDNFIEHNSLVANPGWPSVWRFFSEVTRPSTVPGYYLPLSMTSLMLDHALGGRPDDLRVFHRTSLALHVLVTLLIVLILYRLFGALVPAAVVGLLFGLHPLTVEPVAWVGERKTLLATFFALACLLTYLRHVRHARPRWIVASVALYALALLSKPTVAMLPLLLLLLDGWPLRRLSARTVVEKWPFFLLSLISGVITLLSHQRTVGIGSAAGPGLPGWLAQVGYLLGFYLTKLLWPTGLSPVYQVPAPLDVLDPRVLPAFLCACGVTILCLLSARRTRGPLTGWLFFVLAIAPTLGFVKYSWVSASDKYVYFPILGLLMVLAWGFTAAWGSPRFGHLAGRAALLGPALLLLLAQARGTRATLGHWTDSLALSRHIVEVAPDSPAAHIRLGTLLEQGSAPAEALGHFRRAVELGPDRADALMDLGIALEHRGRFGAAAVHLKAAVRRAPAWADPCNELAWLLATSPDPATRDPAEALRLAARAVELSGRRDPNVLDTQAAAQAAAGRFEEAVQTARAALGLALRFPAGSLVEDLRARLALYEQRVPYRQPAGTLPARPRAR
jgi:Flp pilus assembly protein TadD